MPSPQVVLFARAVSRLFGWIYTLSWSLSFYPQPLLNLQRRSTIGTTPSFTGINIIGFAAYLISSTSLFSSPIIRAQYAARNPGNPEPTVRSNDVAFAAHGVMLSVITCSMFAGKLWGFEQDVGRNGRWRVGKGVWGIATGLLVGLAIVVGLVLVKGRDGGRDPSRWAWIDVIYALGYIKLVVTVVKYIPQVMTNYRRQSTDGWSIWQILMDVVGGCLSLVQLVIDSSLQNDWSGLIGNPTKLGLANISLFFDIIFILQHYVLYRQDRKTQEKDSDGESRDLLASDGDASVHL